MLELLHGWKLEMKIHEISRHFSITSSYKSSIDVIID